jgi:hypothetical protein
VLTTRALHGPVAGAVALAAALVVAHPRARAQDGAPGTGLQADPARTPTTQALTLYDEGMRRFAARELAAAAAAFAAAHALDSRPEYLFAQAQATRQGGDCVGARALFERFLATDPPARQVEATRLALARCTPARPAPAEAPPEPGTLTPSASTPRLPPIPPARPSPLVPPSSPGPRPRRLVSTATLAAVGVAGAATGTTLMLGARGAATSADPRTTYGQYATARDGAERRWTWGAGLVVAGSALIGLALTHFLAGGPAAPAPPERAP